MLEVGDEAPDFTVPLAAGGIESFTLSERLAEEGPIILAFFPGAFTTVCTTEMQTFDERLEDFQGTVYGMSVDSPFALNEFRDKHDLSIGFLSDFEKEVIADWGVRTDFDALGVRGLAKRAVFVVDGDGRVSYSWVGDSPAEEPDYDAVAAAVADTQ